MTHFTICTSISKASIISTGGSAAAKRRPGSLPACWRLNQTVKAPVISMVRIGQPREPRRMPAKMAASWATMKAPSSSSGQMRVSRSEYRPVSRMKAYRAP
jgi:hypothetical protein